MYFAYGEEETDYLKKKDKRMAEVIDRIGHVERKVDTDLFSAVVHHIVGQQISTKAQETIWQRMLSALGEVNAETVLAAGVSKLQSLGMTFRKAEYITDFAEKVHTGAFDLEGIWQKKRRGGYPGAFVPQGHRRVDGGDDPALLHAAAGRAELRRPCHPAGAAHGVPPPEDRPQAV